VEAYVSVIRGGKSTYIKNDILLVVEDGQALGVAQERRYREGY
jgi:hypothetical protein